MPHWHVYALWFVMHRITGWQAHHLPLVLKPIPGWSRHLVFFPNFHIKGCVVVCHCSEAAICFGMGMNQKKYTCLLVPDYKQQDRVYLMPQLHLHHPAKLQDKHATNNL
jgi:hypothetical protein